MSRLGLGLGLSKGRAFSPFDPLSLNPILAYEASRSMMAPLASESLDLDPANPSSLDVITATRAGTATYTDASGNIQTASPNTVRVDHPQGEQLTPAKYQRVKYTDFSSGWGSIGATSQAGNGYLGQPSLIVNAPVLNARKTTSVPTETGVSYTASFYVRYVSGSSGLVWMYRQFSGEGITATPITVTSEWTRVQVQFTGGSGSTVNFGVSPKVAGESVEIAMPQVEEGTTASDFVENTTGSPKYFAAATYAPRVPMILVEPAATNLISYTDFSSGWSDFNLTIVDGEGFSGQVSKVLTAVGSNAYYAHNVDTLDGVNYHGGFWIRRISGSGTLRIRHVYSESNTETGAVTVGSEWVFVSADFLGKSGGGFVQFGIKMTSSGDSVEIAMPQAEAGTIATSFIPTSGSAVTRAADDLVIDGSDFTNFYNTVEGTFYVEAVMNSDSDGSQNWILGSQSSSARFLYQHSSANQLKSFDGTSVVGSFTSTTKGELFRYALTFDATTRSVSYNGETTINGSHNGNYGSVPTALFIGSQNAFNHAKVSIKRLIYWPYHSDNL